MISAKGRRRFRRSSWRPSGFDHEGREARLHDYESPEEANGDTPDDRSGIYSVGGDRRDAHHAAADAPWASAPSASNPKVPKEIDAVVLKPCAQPGSRFQSAVAFAGELRSSIAVLDALGVAGEEEELAQTSSTSVGRVLAMAGGMLLVAAVLAVVVVVMTAAIPTSSGSPRAARRTSNRAST